MKEYKGLVNLDFPETPYSTYIMYSEDLSDKSIYIGVTEGYIQRAYKHSIDRFHKDLDVYEWMNNIIEIQKKKVLFKLLEKEKYTEKEAYLKEIELIKEYKQKGYTVINKSEGGKGYKGNIPWNKGKKMNEEYSERLSKSHIGLPSNRKGKKCTEEQIQRIIEGNKKRKERGWINPKRITVYKYDQADNLITTYSHLKEAVIAENTTPSSIGEWCRGEKSPRNKNFKWSYQKLN